MIRFVICCALVMQFLCDGVSAQFWRHSNRYPYSETSTARSSFFAPKPRVDSAQAEIEDSLKAARRVIAAGNEFGLGLMKHLIRAEENTIMAPVSLSVALGMLYFAAEGNTKKQLGRALHYEENGLDSQTIATPLQYLTHIAEKVKPQGVVLESANFVFAQRELNVSRDYKDTIKNLFRAAVVPIDFKRPGQALQQMNSLISKETNNLIVNPIESVNPSARVMVTNAVYFKGFWKKPFSVRSSFDSTFLNDGISETPVKMMYMRDNFSVKAMPELDADALQLPYDGEASVMLVLLPRDPQGVHTMLQRLDIGKVLDELSTYKNESLDLHMPRFTVSGSYRFKEQLQDLGVRDIFTPGKSRLPKIDPEDETVLDDVIHEAKIRVDERGTEAQAITTATIINYSSHPSFNIRHPFVFFVVHKDLRSIFFAGKILRMDGGRSQNNRN